MSEFQKHLDDEVEIVLAIKRGAIGVPEISEPDNHIETGLAHIFFFGERVFKQYKIVGDSDHFIKGVLAPTEQRHDFLERDFAINQHFSGGVYKAAHTHVFKDGVFELAPYERTSPHVWFEMERLDFSQNFHEQLLRQEVTKEHLYALGYYTAGAVATSPVQAPIELNWYKLALERISFLDQFIAWLPDQYRTSLEAVNCTALLRQHLAAHRTYYEGISGTELVVTLDNHDENIFFKDGGPVFIDVVPPMQSWWYGLPAINLANITVNVEALLSKEAALEVERGFMEYHNLVTLPEPDYSFARALALVISAVHFGSSPGKEKVAETYIAHCQDIGQWL